MRAFLFPGQGSQQPGMGKDLFYAFSEYRGIFRRANELTGIDWFKIIEEAEASVLAQTENTQPCLFLTCASILSCPGVAGKFDATAGHSLGEYSALYASGVLSFEDALACVVERGRLMSQAKKGGMLAPMGIELEQIEKIITEFEDSIILIANYNSPGQYILSGEEAILESVSRRLVECGAKRVVRLPVSGAFHSPLMEPAKIGMAHIIEKIEFHSPKIAYYSNVSGKKEDDPKTIKDLLLRQITSPVRWIDLIRSMQHDDINEFIEIGPGKVLSGLVKRIIPEAKLYSISDLDTLREYTNE